MKEKLDAEQEELLKEINDKVKKKKKAMNPDGDTDSEYLK